MGALSVKNLSFAYGRKPVLEGLSFDVRAGETLVVAGLSGSGKTTLCQILCGIIPNAVPGTISGRVMIGGDDITGASLALTATRAGLVFQDADSQIICTTVEDELAFGLENLCVETGEIRRRVDAMLRLFGLWEERLQNPSRLSGGQKRLVTIAGVLILEPQILILDEPMSALDTDGRSLVRQAIDDLHRQGATIIIVEHDLRSVTWADRWLVLQDGRIAALDTPRKLMAEPDRLRALGLWFDEAIS